MTASIIPSGQLTLSGPSDCLDRARLPVRGDLAHIGLAGRCFVPHYAVPMPHLLKAAATLRGAELSDGNAIDQLRADTLFNVLDMSGGWAWGQVGDGGLVGYLPLDVLVERRD
ncbi:MAG TPA: SH3 domain-containing protein [Novosphingobium sp.]|nr:SH3 domain-containing protein [Novosphingobium sp.]